MLAMPLANQTRRMFSYKTQILFKPYSAYSQAMGSAQEQQRNKQVVRQYFEAYDRQDTERIEQLVSSSNYTLHLSGMPSPMDWNGTKQFYTSIWSAFPDLHHDILDMVAEDSQGEGEGEDKVAVRYNIIGTHKGELQGIPPTGKKVSFGAMDFITLIDGKVAEEWETADTMGLMQQIGAIPSSSSSSSASPSADNSRSSSNSNSSTASS
jgi:steroid delta-isomerase-like uncharacterized protein